MVHLLVLDLLFDRACILHCVTVRKPQPGCFPIWILLGIEAGLEDGTQADHDRTGIKHGLGLVVHCIVPDVGVVIEVLNGHVGHILVPTLETVDAGRVGHLIPRHVEGLHPGLWRTHLR